MYIYLLIIECKFIVVSIFDQLFDEDDEDDEFKPDNLENEEDDEESVCKKRILV